MTQDELKTLRDRLSSLETTLLIDEDLNTFDTPLKALKEIYNTTELYEELSDIPNFTFKTEIKDNVFTLTIDEKENYDLLIRECERNGITCKKQLLVNLDFEIQEIDELSILQAKKLLGDI